MWAITRSGHDVLDDASCESWRYVNWERRHPASFSGDEAPGSGEAGMLSLAVSNAV